MEITNNSPRQQSCHTDSCRGVPTLRSLYPQFPNTYPLSFHMLVHSFALFCTQQKPNPHVFKRFRTLRQKTEAWGYPCTISNSARFIIPGHSHRSEIRRGALLESPMQLLAPRSASGNRAELLRDCAVLSDGRERLSRSAGWKHNRVPSASGECL